jgi:hypothetical protein
VFSEFNAHWLAGFMSGLDKAWTLGTGQPEVHMAGVYDHSAPPDKQPGMINHFEYNTKWPYPLMPSDYIRRQVHLTFMDDHAAIELRELTGVDALMWSSDYPHPEGTWPRSQQAVDAQFARVDDEARFAILGKTVLRLYAGVR